MEQYLNYILTIKSLNVLATLMIFLSQLKNSIKGFIQKRQTSKTAIAELFSKISNKKKISQINNLSLPGKHFSRESTKPVNSQTNIKSSGNESLTVKFYKHLSN